MKEIGIIVDVKKDKGIVRLSSKKECRHCSMNQLCQSTDPGNRVLEVGLGGKNYQVGDCVQIMTSAKSYMTAAALVFMVPLIISIAGYALVYSITRSQGWGIAGFTGFLVLSGFFLYWFDKRFGKKRFFEPRIIGKVNRSLG
ncbi:MAG: SoxR reducing system RseC family protein [bacterium]